MASLADRLPGNVDGDFFVDKSCIDCETCMIVAPGVFADSGGASYVKAQPASDSEIHRAMMALIACPTSSIGTVSGRKSKAAATAFPEEIAPDVFYLGYASEDSFGASSYLIRRAEGNVLVDSPRAAAPLLKGIEALGGAKMLFLTHRDDIADHAKLREVFRCERIMMKDDARGMECERRLEGSDPIAIAPDLRAIPTPGHTRGSACLLFRDILFGGDHIAGDANGRLDAWPNVNWYSWKEQRRSLEKLLEVEFTRVLPGHGRPFRAATQEAARAALRELLARLP